MRPTFLAAVLLPVAAAASAQEQARSAVVKVYTTYQSPNYMRPWEMRTQQSLTGSGAIIAGHRILTNAHVVSDQTFVRVQRADLPDKCVARVVAVSHEFDLALLTTDDAFFEGTQPLAIGKLPAIGDAVSALGFPTGGTRVAVTKGVVSRIDRGSYSHSWRSNLVCQIDAAINPGSSGGPVVGDGAVVGVAFQSGSGENIGYIVPAPVIEHFLKDIEDGHRDGAPSVPLVWQVLENPQLREACGLSDGQRGVRVTKISAPFDGDDMLRAGDVLLGVDGFDIANDGTIEFRPGERIEFTYAVDRKQLGDSLALRILRDGKPREVTLALSAANGCADLVPRAQYETTPSYYVLGGLVFAPLTLNYIHEWSDWNDVPIGLKRYYYEMRTAANAERREVVVLIDVLADELNVGYEFYQSVVSEANGHRVNSLKDLVTAIEGHDGPFHTIVLEDRDAHIVLKRDGLAERSKEILRRYRVPEDRSDDLKATK
ncbi:MAG TPA: serine protease [Planctomycetota bacterium]|nr:serine protease [Planctomycetota bacterium]